MKNANPVSPVLLTGILLLAGCGENARQPVAIADRQSPVGNAKSIADWFTLKVGDRTVRVQVAVRQLEMERGLMERRDLAWDDGMLFVYPSPMRVAFWMKNTPTPLDIAYFTPDGALAEVYAAFPFDERTLPSRSERIQFILEMNQGWYAQNGIKAGAKLDLAAIATALKERGFDPAAFGLK